MYSIILLYFIRINNLYCAKQIKYFNTFFTNQILPQQKL